jgi:hypothetical protein
MLTGFAVFSPTPPIAGGFGLELQTNIESEHVPAPAANSPRMAMLKQIYEQNNRAEAKLETMQACNIRLEAELLDVQGRTNCEHRTIDWKQSWGMWKHRTLTWKHRTMK